jgi:hypothetical protein
MKKQTSIIVSLLLLLIIILGGYWIWQSNKPQKQPNQNQNTQQNVEQNVNKNQEPEVITSDVDQSSEALAKVDTSDWQTYRNEELGFEFMYPKSIGELQESTNLGDTGKMFSVSTKEKPSLFVISGVTSDYTRGVSGSFGTSQGYIIDENGIYNFVFVDNRLIPIEVNQIIKAPIGDIVIVNVRSLENNLLSPGKDNIVALINLNSDTFKGLSAIKYSEYGLDNNIFYSILKSINKI